MKATQRNDYLTEAKDLIGRSPCVLGEKEALLSDLRKVEKEMAGLIFRLDRTIKEKRTLSTLLARTSEDLEKSSELIKKMFGRYLSTEIMNTLLDDPAALELGGEKRTVTIMVTDLRGFTALSERLEPEQVVQMLNAYFEVMVDVILQYHGTINEITGDSLLVIFGAPQPMPDRAQRAIACAIDMQNAMRSVNERNGNQGLPPLEMGIGINDTEVIVGNIGSSKRSKYAVVGSGVNVASRIESYTVGGQILISESVYRETGPILRIDAQQDVVPKGMESSIRVYEVGGIAGQYHLALEYNDPPLAGLARVIPFHYSTIDGEMDQKNGDQGFVARLSANSAEVVLNEPIHLLTNLKMQLDKVEAKLSACHFYGKVMEAGGDDAFRYLIRFTSLPPSVDAFFEAHRQHAVA